MNTRPDWGTLAVVAALHAGLLFVLLSMEPVSQAVGLTRPLFASLVRPEPPRPENLTELPRPLPARPRPVERVTPLVPVLAAPETAAPVAHEVPLAPPQAEPLPPVLPTPASAAVAPAPQSPAAPVIPPRFDADYLDNPAPAYPALSRRLGEQGRVLLRVYVQPDGTAAQVEIKASSGFERLDRVARDTVSRWRFVPARQGEAAVGAWVVIPISFSLRS